MTFNNYVQNLKETGTITTTWNIDDVQSLDATLTDSQAKEVLYQAKRRHDANDGINWAVLQVHIDWLKSEIEEDPNLAEHIEGVWSQHSPTTAL